MRFLAYHGLSAGDLSAQVEKVRAAIERDDFRSADVKKLHHGSYYRAKLDGASRLLLQFVEHGEEKACLALEVIRNHAYDRSRFLRGAPVDEGKLPASDAPVREDFRRVRYLHPQRAVFHHLDKPISFDDQQDEVLRRRPPLVLVGSAGSGKTALLLERLRQAHGRVAYITESRWLAETSRALYVAFEGAPAEQEADFLSYRQLIETAGVPEGKPIAFRDFADKFLSRHKQRIPFADAHQVFEELRGVLTAQPEGPLSREAYLSLGVRQSIFDQDQRAALYDLFERYRPFLSQEGYYEPNLVAHAWLAKMEPVYDFVAVDEVQDLTNVQLSLILRALKTPGQFVIAGDANQIVHPNFFSWANVKSLFFRGLAGEQEALLLDVSYRNGDAVTAAANSVLRLKHARFGSIDRESNLLMRPLAGIAGSVGAIAAGSAAVKELNERTRASARAAVLVLREEHKAEARQRLSTPLVFTIHEAKGLEYDTVILYRMISAERQLFTSLCEGIDKGDLTKTELDYRRARDKSDKSLEIYKFYVNALYVGLTRAISHAVLIEDDLGHPLLSLLGIGGTFGASQVAAQKSTAEEWQREAHRLEAQGKAEQAAAIRSQVLQERAVPWPVYDGRELRALAALALPRESVSSKAKQRLFEMACFHEEELLALRLEEARFAPAQQYDLQRGRIADRVLEPFAGRNFKEILADTERYGVDYRTPQNLTPLMLAARAGNVPLIEALLGRGASLEARDHCGRSAMHWALRAAYRDPQYASTVFGTVFDLTAPPSFDIEVSGKLLQIGREMGEFFFFSTLIARFDELYTSLRGRHTGIQSEFFLGDSFAGFPRAVIAPERKRRIYVNGLLARNEPGSNYVPNRQLWLRETRGHYIPNPELRLRAAGGGWIPLYEVMDLAFRESLLNEDAYSRLTAKAPAPDEAAGRSRRPR